MLTSRFYSEVLDPVKRCIIMHKLAVACHNVGFDSIACCGIGGLLVAPALAERLQKHLIVIRKPTDQAYSHLRVEAVADARRVLWVDDYYSTGRTLQSSMETLSERDPTAQLVAALFYREISGGIKYHGKTIPVLHA